MADWFVNVGQLEKSSLNSWDDWPGPEDPLCEAIGTIAQKYFDNLSDQHGLDYDTFMLKVKEVLSDISTVHEWDQDEDCYDSRSAAAWEASWWVALKYYYDEYGVIFPEIARKMMDFLAAGCWPYGLSETGEILIY